MCRGEQKQSGKMRVLYDPVHFRAKDERYHDYMVICVHIHTRQKLNSNNKNQSEL